jgi:hypothetical protein
MLTRRSPVSIFEMKVGATPTCPPMSAERYRWPSLPANTLPLKNMLCQIKANSCNVHFGRLSRLTG